MLSVKLCIDSLQNARILSLVSKMVSFSMHVEGGDAGRCTLTGADLALIEESNRGKDCLIRSYANTGLSCSRAAKRREREP